MSYEILLYPREPGQDWAEVLAADEADTPAEVLGDEAAMTAGVETFRRIEGRLRRFITGDVETWVAEETGGDVLGEFTATDTGLQVELYHGSASVSFPYRQVDNLSSFHIKVREAVRIVAEETGYKAYDAQTETDFDDAIHDRERRAQALAHPQPADSQAEDVDVQVPDDASSLTDPPAGRATVLAGDTVPAVDPAVVDAQEKEMTPREKRMQAMLEARRDPVRVRRRAIFDLVLSGLIIIWVMWRANTGEVGFLTTVLIILAVMNLFSGGLGLRAANRLEKEQAEAGAPSSSTDDPNRPQA